MKPPVYHELLDQLRQAFPQPVSDRQHDAYFVFSIMRALDQVDSMKSEVPLLGTLQDIDYAAAEQARLKADASTLEDVSHRLVESLNGLPIWGHPRTQINVVPPSTIPSIIGRRHAGTIAEAIDGHCALRRPSTTWQQSVFFCC